LILIISDRLTLTAVIVAAIVALVGYLVIRLISRLAANGQRADEAVVLPASVDTEPIRVQAQVASHPSQPVTLDLTEEDARMLHRLATLLREVPSESGAS
jgi:hypothetical protein